jgi:hypothetical protein
MDERDLAIEETTHEHIAALSDGSRNREDFMALLMRPPAATNRAPGDRVGQRWDAASGRFEHDAADSNEIERLPWRHSDLGDTASYHVSPAP